MGVGGVGGFSWGQAGAAAAAGMGVGGDVRCGGPSRSRSPMPRMLNGRLTSG